MADLNSESARAALDQAAAMARAARQRAVWPRWAAITEAVLWFLYLLVGLYGLILLGRPETEVTRTVGGLLLMAGLVLIVPLGLFERFMSRRLGIVPAASKTVSWVAFRNALVLVAVMIALTQAAIHFGWLWAPLPAALIVAARIYRRRCSGLGRC